jgi:hypothetical protein
MPEPKTKERMLKRLNDERRRLEAVLAKLSVEDMLLPETMKPYSFKDALAHLAHWEANMLVWIDTSRRGETPAVPEEGYTMKDESGFNLYVLALHKDMSLEQARAYFDETHHRFMAHAELVTDEEMLSPGYFAFTGKSPLYSWYSAYANHDAWARKKMQAWLKQQGR